MNYSNPIVEARLVRREKRFFAYCTLDGAEVVAHCPNPGSMKGNLAPESDVWLFDFGADHLQTGRKLRYKWFLVSSGGVDVVVDTSCANAIVGEALREGRVAGFEQYFDVQAERKVGASRIDFYLPGSSDGRIPDAYIEVKSVSMGEGETGAFPDSVTERGQKHLRELMELKAAGKRAVLFFLLMRKGGKRVRAAEEIDPEYARLLREAIKRGVEVIAYGVDVTKEGIRLGKKAEVVC